MVASKLTMRETSSHVYFWGGIYSQWHISNITLHAPVLRMNQLVPAGDFGMFNCAEQYMMASKALLFGDHDALQKIMNSKDPREQKALGRTVQGFNDTVWRQHARSIVFLANWGKFTYDGHFLKTLLDTGDKIIVEGSPYDRVWGVGLSWDDPAIEDATNWRGTNWLGECIMAVRDIVRREGSQANPWLLHGSWQHAA